MGFLTRPKQFMLSGAYGVNVKDFGPQGMVGNGDPVYDGPAFAKALALVSTNSAYRGATVMVPRGYYRPDATIQVTPYAPELIDGIYLKGEGRLNTVIDGAAMPAGSDCVAFNGHSAEFGIEGLGVVNAKRYGLSIRGGAKGSNFYAAQGYARDLRIQGSGLYGLYSENSFNLTLDNIWSTANGQSGFVFEGNHTTLKMGKLWAANHLTGPGYQFNGVSYSAMDVCAADNNMWGYVFYNCSGFTMNGCGAEASLRSNIFMRNATVLNDNIIPEYLNTTAFVINGGFWLHGNLGFGSGVHPSFIEAVTSNAGGFIDVVLNGNRSIKNPAHAADWAIAATAVAGSTIRFRGASNTFDSLNSFGGAGTAEFIGT